MRRVPREDRTPVSDLIFEVDVARKAVFYESARALTADSVAADRDIWECPYTVTNASVLAGAGYRINSPMSIEFDWPPAMGKFPALEHQRVTACFMTLWRRAYCLNEMGTGKTYAIAAAVEYLFRVGYVRRVVVLCPRSTMFSVWRDTFRHTFPHREVVVVHGTAKNRRKLIAKPADIYVMNHAGLEVVSNVYRETVKRTLPDGTEFEESKQRVIGVEFPRRDIDMFILDESGEYRNSRTLLWAITSKVIGSFPNAWAWALTGAPIPQSPTDAWAQAKLIRPETVDLYFSQFRARVMTSPTEGLWVPKPEAAAIAYAALFPAIRFTKADCTDIPPLMYSDRHCELSTLQHRLFKDMAEELRAEIAEGVVIDAANEAVKLSKLIQIACGAVYDKTGTTAVIGAPDRLKVLEEIIEQAPKKVVVFVPYTNVLNYVAEHLSKRWSVVTMTGETGDNDRTRIFREFQTLPDPHVLVANPKCMSHGTNLTAAATEVWYCITMSNNVYVQANERTPRLGQTESCEVVHLMSSKVEQRYLARLRSRGRVQGLLLEMARDNTLKDILE